MTVGRAVCDDRRQSTTTPALTSTSSSLARLAQFVLGEMGVDPDAELSLMLVDEAAMTKLHEKFMGEPGPTDVLAFPDGRHG